MITNNQLPQATRRHFLKTSAGLLALGASSRFHIHAEQAVASAPSLLSPPNEKIQKAREVALAVLKPSQRDLDHGLELHANSLVFESYGFAPRCALDGDAFRAAVEAGASDSELVDLREEMSMTRCATNAAERKEFLESFRAAGATCIFQNAGKDGSVVLGKILDNAKYSYGYNAQTSEYGDLVAQGVIDPAKVVRHALQNAGSVAGLLITTEAMVAELPKKEAAPAMPGGGMGGMDF